jgi:hypothetical protein
MGAGSRESLQFAGGIAKEKYRLAGEWDDPTGIRENLGGLDLQLEFRSRRLRSFGRDEVAEHRIEEGGCRRAQARAEKAREPLPSGRGPGFGC